MELDVPGRLHVQIATTGDGRHSRKRTEGRARIKMMCKSRSPPSHGAVPSWGAEIGQRLEGMEVWKSLEAGKEGEAGGLEARQAPSTTNHCPRWRSAPGTNAR